MKTPEGGGKGCVCCERIFWKRSASAETNWLVRTSYCGTAGELWAQRLATFHRAKLQLSGTAILRHAVSELTSCGHKINVITAF